MYRSAKRLARKAAALALEKKAENVISMDLRGLTSSCDFFVICDGLSDVHVKAIADSIVDGLTEAGEKPWHKEGYEAKHWILLDFVNVVVHVFDKKTRDYYRLESLWGDAKTETFEDE